MPSHGVGRANPPNTPYPEDLLRSDNNRMTRLTAISHLRYSPSKTRFGGSDEQRQDTGKLGEGRPEGTQGQATLEPALAYAQELRRQAALHRRRSRRLRGRQLAARPKTKQTQQTHNHVRGSSVDHSPV